MSGSEVDGLLARLVAQFESPYDFVREVVQNAMDAGSDRVEVVLDMHADTGASDPDAVVFELTMADTGRGMDETIIDEELTHLFASSKTGDRTMAGGFGIGFVSVFAWNPDAVLLQTGRAGEAWELLFHGDRSFDKLAVDQPFEGTTVTLLRRGRSGERDAIAEAIRDSLWRWCRYCPLEISFEDRRGDEAPELIQDSPEPDDAAVLVTHETGDSLIRVAFAVPGRVILLRRGLILAEGNLAQQLPGVASELGASGSHLRIWADSPQLRTTLARDRVVDDEGRSQIERRILQLVDEARRRLIDRIEAEATSTDAWTRARHEHYAMLHAHASAEHSALGDLFDERRLLRRVDGSACTAREWLATSSRWPVFVASSIGRTDPRWRTNELLLAQLRRSSLPILEADLAEDEPWLRTLAHRLGRPLIALEAIASRVAPAETGRGMCGIVEALLRGCGAERVGVRLCRFLDGFEGSAAQSAFGVQLPGVTSPVALRGDFEVPFTACNDAWLWLDADHPLVEASMRSFDADPVVAGLVLAANIQSTCIDDQGSLLDPKQLDASARVVAAQGGSS